MIFNRAAYDEMLITLTSNEALGVLDSEYIEDYFGVDGQITIYSIDTGLRIPVLMNEIIEETPGVIGDVFRGFLPLIDIPDGYYKIEGRVRDLIGNYTVLSEVANPLGTERIIALQFRIISAGTADPDSPHILDMGIVTIQGSIALNFEFNEQQVFELERRTFPEFDSPVVSEVELFTPIGD